MDGAGDNSKPPQHADQCSSGSTCERTSKAHAVAPSWQRAIPSPSVGGQQAASITARPPHRLPQSPHIPPQTPCMPPRCRWSRATGPRRRRPAQRRPRPSRDPPRPPPLPPRTPLPPRPPPQPPRAAAAVASQRARPLSRAARQRRLALPGPPQSRHRWAHQSLHAAMRLGCGQQPPAPSHPSQGLTCHSRPKGAGTRRCRCAAAARRRR
mmetsp:Transcript_117712/g.313142  ORF Transcript_117712/g.313142 Transcript_117712/m.313142 type:complete len:210 (-) Transcript_117712:766-1395(-)